ncbi:hypothetical protein RHGRI_017875 [Rhododendron griersonianum]|uniref:Uncharacterized protein n=1 Tax=Rhododendron griersonianum TaxID=479676 RepID=A0AAV6JZC9_9ERIC|nr:hypothetical protein RHGRI_017875 [Rhododendron griersonianum]
MPPPPPPLVPMEVDDPESEVDVGDPPPPHLALVWLDRNTTLIKSITPVWRDFTQKMSTASYQPTWTSRATSLIQRCPSIENPTIIPTLAILDDKGHSGE